MPARCACAAQPQEGKGSECSGSGAERSRGKEKSGWEPEVSLGESGGNVRDYRHCCCLDFTFSEFGIVPEASGENICVNEVPCGRKGVCWFPGVRLIRCWLRSRSAAALGVKVGRG